MAADRRLRLLISTDPIGGVWDYTATLAHLLSQEGHAVLLASIGLPSDEQVARLPEEIAIEARDSRLEWMSMGARDVPATGEWLARLGERWRSDVVHLNQMAYPSAARFGAPTLVVVHSDVHSWFGEVRKRPPPEEWAPYTRLVRAGLRSAAAVAAPSAYQARLVERHYQVSGIRVIHNATLVSAVAKPRTVRPLVLTAGRAWDEAKGIGLLDRALAAESRRGAPTVHHIGALIGPDGARFSPTRLACHGPVSREEVVRWMGAATIYVAPSIYEPFGLAPLEAARRGCALLLNDIGSFRELWDGAAHFVACERGDALVEALRELSGDPSRIAALSQAARERARTRFGPDRFAREYLAMYAALRDGRAPGAARPAASVAEA